MRLARITLALLSAVVAGWGVHAATQPMTQQQRIIVVRSDESKTLLWNPTTHEEVRNETADGNVIMTVRPKGESDDAGR